MLYHIYDRGGSTHPYPIYDRGGSTHPYPILIRAISSSEFGGGIEEVEELGFDMT
jgi:hypothetical protein